MRDCDVVRVSLKTMDGRVLELPLYVVPLICEPLANQPVVYCKAEYDHLASLKLAEFSDQEGDTAIGLLIGCDHYWKLVTGEVVRGRKGPTAIHTKLGWVLSGPTDTSDQHVQLVNATTSHTLRISSQPQAEDRMDVMFTKFWELESLGVENDKVVSVLQDFDSEIVFEDNRYQVSLPWKHSHPVLPDNYHLSKKRLCGLLRRLRQQPSILKE